MCNLACDVKTSPSYHRDGSLKEDSCGTFVNFSYDQCHDDDVASCVSVNGIHTRIEQNHRLGCVVTGISNGGKWSAFIR